MWIDNILSLYIILLTAYRMWECVQEWIWDEAESDCVRLFNVLLSSDQVLFSYTQDKFRETYYTTPTLENYHLSKPCGQRSN